MVTLPYRERHQGTHLFQEIHVSGDVTIDGNLTFGNTATDDLILKGRMSSMTLAGAAISLGASYTYSEGIEMLWSVASWTGIGSSFRGVYYRASNDIAGATNDIYGMELYSVANDVNTGNLKGLLSYAYVKGASAKTILTGYGVHGELSWDAGAAATTVTTEMAAGLFKITGGNMLAPSAFKVHGIIIRAGDMDGASPIYGNGILIEDDSAMSGTVSWNNAISITSPATNGINLAGAMTNAIVIAGTSTSIIRATGAATNLLSFDAVEGCVSTQAGGTATYSHKLAVNIDGVGEVYIPLAASFA